MSILMWILILAEAWIAGPVFYLCILSLSALIAEKKQKAQEEYGSARTNFAILVPAHNEEAMLGGLLESLAALEYPKDQYTVYVVADNCTDATANLVRATGWVHVYERFDSLKRGKGYALGWLLQELEANKLIHDAYLILDADSVVIPTFLHSMAKELDQGIQALQARYTVRNVKDSPCTLLRWIALTLMCHVRPLGRNALGASATLTGNGMCLSRALLMRLPWQAYSLTEDYEYYLTLVKHGEYVKYVPEAIVYAYMPTTFTQMRVQDVRWEVAGTGKMLWPTLLHLLKTGWRYRDFVRIEAGIELLTPPLSFLLSCCLLILLLSVLLSTLPNILFSLVLIGGLMFYVGSAFYSRPPFVAYKALLHVPSFMLWKVWVYLILTRSRKHTSEWVHTHRPVSIK